MQPKILSRDNKHLGTMIVDLILMIAGLWFFVEKDAGSGMEKSSPAEITWMFLVVISVVPWYMGYIFRHFETFGKVLQNIIKWFFGIITISLIVFLIMTYIPFMEADEAPSGAETFLIAFGMFFMVLGPMMMVGGYIDGNSLDESRFPGKPYLKLTSTMIMGMLAAAVVYMILIVGWFDPGWTGDIGFFPVLLAFLGGTFLGMLTFAPFIYLGKGLEKIDKPRIIPFLVYLLMPVLVFNTLFWWNDIVLYELSSFWEGGHPSVANILWSMTLAGIIPFRLIMLLRPPFRWTGLVFALISVGVYTTGVLYQYGAI